MFKKTSTTPQLDMFSDPSLQLGKRASKKYQDPKAWHNQFFSMVTSKIDEDIFKPLFKEGNMGAPNASVRIIVAMSILKEGFGCSDEELFEKCEFDLLTRRALGLVNLDDKLPSLDTCSISLTAAATAASSAGAVTIYSTCLPRTSSTGLSMKQLCQ